ncbi:MAG: hypothetical protein JL50_19875 [Peptococcaceae bacterium BICA1-7]|nr:MAG: hypothetical protein JL50_19875 [Peptococcaceae bacterium BICA1-7]HBV98337.1 radical SAM protein [Desulfotomaculum sp.]
MQLNSALIREAWQARSRNFPPSVTFHCPEQTLSVSLTGDRCDLQCGHCGGRFIKKMMPWERFKSIKADGGPAGKAEVKSCLISGGCDRQGKVPFWEHARELKKIKEASMLRFNFHVGLVEEKEAQLLKGLADVVSFDFLGSDRTIQNILGLSRSVDDYVASYKAIKANVPVVPHICIGLDGGKITGEYRALELLAGLNAGALVFIVFIPSPGTRLEDKKPPPLDEVVHLLALARVVFQDVPIHLGCMRPGGRYRRELDLWSLRCGINHLVMPSREAVAEARSLGLTIKYRKECCVL